MSSPPTGVLKFINKFLLQAKKIDAVEPAVAYYTRLYAITIGMKNKQTKADSLVIAELMDWCENHRSSSIENFSRDEARQRVETFALEIFQYADNQDRQGNSSKSIAASFYSAYIFMEVCKQFGELSSDIKEKWKYSMWKFTEITKALKEGRKPTAGPPMAAGDENNGEEEKLFGYDQKNNHVDSSDWQEKKYEENKKTPEKVKITGNFNNQKPMVNNTELPSAYPMPSNPFVSASAPPPAYSSMPTPAPFNPPPAQNPSSKQNIPAQQPVIRHQTAAPSHHAAPSDIPSAGRLQASKDAERLLRHAQSALSFDDFETTIEKIQQTLAILMPHKGQKQQYS